MMGRQGDRASCSSAATIEIAPLAFMRGRTLNHAFVILDEAQNTTPEQMKMFLTRIGFGSKAVITGDVTQIDLPRGARWCIRWCDVDRTTGADADDAHAAPGWSTACCTCRDSTTSAIEGRATPNSAPRTMEADVYDDRAQASLCAPRREAAATPITRTW
jgi:hypothetical protein